MRKLDALLSRGEEILIGLLILSASLILFANVIARYVFNDGFSWAEELVRYQIVWLTEAARETTEFEREETARREEGYLATIEASGTNVSTLDDDQLEAFRAATASVHDAFESEIGAELMDEFHQAMADAE